MAAINSFMMWSLSAGAYLQTAHIKEGIEIAPSLHCSWATDLHAHTVLCAHWDKSNVKQPVKRFLVVGSLHLIRIFPLLLGMVSKGPRHTSKNVNLIFR